MKKILVLCSAFLLVFSLSGVAGAISIDFFSMPDGSGGLTSPYSPLTVETFEGSLSWTWTPAIPSSQVNVVTGSSPNHYVALPTSPLNPTNHYVTVPFDGTSGSAKVTNLGGTYNYFGIWWGSVDQYNTLSFYLSSSPNPDDPVASFTPGSGGFLTGVPYGSSTDELANRYVNFHFLPNFDSFAMTSTTPAFEADNIAVGNVIPEPATMLLLGSGLLGIGVFARRRFRKK